MCYLLKGFTNIMLHFSLSFFIILKMLGITNITRQLDYNSSRVIQSSWSTSLIDNSESINQLYGSSLLSWRSFLVSSCSSLSVPGISLASRTSWCSSPIRRLESDFTDWLTQIWFPYEQSQIFSRGIFHFIKDLNKVNCFSKTDQIHTVHQ